MKDMEKENSIECRGEIVLYQPDEKTRLEVRIDSDTVWLSQQQMAHLFDVKENTITYHLKEIYNSRELDVESTARKIRVVRLEGTRKVNPASAEGTRQILNDRRYGIYSGRQPEESWSFDDDSPQDFVYS